jgi:hypothetical protein
MRIRRVGRPVAAAGVGLGGLYLLALLLVSLTSDERVLEAGAPKRFCGLYLDCHRLVTLVGVERTDRIGSLPAAGTFHVVTLRLASDAKRATLPTGRMTAVAQDDAGRRFGRSTGAERALAGEGPVGLPDTALAPGAAVTTRLVFELPPDAANPRLHVRDARLLSVLTELVLIGDEDSFLHARTTFALGDRGTALRIPRVVCGVEAGCDTVIRVVDLRRAPAAGTPPDRVPADGLFYIFTVEIRGPEAALVAEVRDATGHTYGRAHDVEALLPPPPPGRTRWVFDLPDRAPGLRLELRPPGTLNRLIAAPVSIALPA